jgi:hypothetical protein
VVLTKSHSPHHEPHFILGAPEPFEIADTVFARRQRRRQLLSSRIVVMAAA